MEKKIFSKDLVIGNTVDNCAFLLKQIGKPFKEEVRFVLSDVKGAVAAAIHESAMEGMTAGRVVIVSGAVITKPGTIEPLLKCKEIRYAEAGEYRMSDIQDTLSEERKIALIEEVKKYISKVFSEGYRALLEALLTDEVLGTLGDMPATLAEYATYQGGALVTMASLCAMATSSMASYATKGNGFYTRMPNWSALLTACLLSRYGVLTYYVPYYVEDNFVGFRKSNNGVNLGYQANLYFQIQSKVTELQIPISTEDLTYLFNVLDCTKAVSKDCLAFHFVLNLFRECDRIDCELSDYQENGAAEETADYFYSDKLNRYLKKEERREAV